MLQPNRKTVADYMALPEFPRVELIDKDRLEKLVNGPPDLAIEVLSPPHTERDRIEKRDLYFESGVAEYWIADPETHTIEVRRRGENDWAIQGVYPCAEEIPSAQLPGVRIPVAEIFR
ncbi:MAG: Uma2 family endonuclease [Planctomycetes bacterium]|nr:Uma2 family endonuclease [Planctomycetota bacterium]